MSLAAWFRFYSEVLNDPKILRLSDRQYRTWINLLCIASQNGGRIRIADVELLLRVQKGIGHRIVRELIEIGLLDRLDDAWCEPHNWSGRQYQSDDSKERVQRYRERQRNVTPTVTGNALQTVTVTPSDTDTDQIQIRTETEGADQTRARARKAPLASLIYEKRTQPMRRLLHEGTS